MKKTAIILALACVTGTFFLSSCGKKKSKSYDDYASYVNSRTDSAEYYYDREWDELEAEYNTRKSAVESDMDNLDENSRSEYAKLDQKWGTFKTTYVERNSKIRNLRAGLIPADVETDFSNVGPDRLLSVYTHFVDYVDAHKVTFDREMWDEVKIIYERLDAHKNTVEKDLPKGHNAKIAEQKIRFNAERFLENGGEVGKDKKQE